MKRLFTLICLVSALFISCSDKEDPTPQEKTYEVELSDLKHISSELTSAEFTAAIRYADKVAFMAIPLADASNADAKTIINNGTEIELDASKIWNEEQVNPTQFVVDELTNDTEYRLFVAAVNNKSQSYKLAQIDFRTKAEEKPEPKKELKLTLTPSEATDLALSFLISSENAVELAWIVKTDITEEFYTPEAVLEKGVAASEEELNTEFLAVWQEGLMAETAYQVYAAARDAEGNTLMENIEMTTLATEVIETIAYSGGEAEVINPNPHDAYLHLLTLENDEYIISLSLTGNRIDSFFSTSGSDYKINVENSKVEKKGESGNQTLPAFSPSDGALTIMSDVVSGKWEIEGTLFLVDDTMVTINYSGDITGVQIEGEMTDTIEIENISASVNTDVSNTVWYLEFADRSGNTVGLSIQTYQEIAYIPSGEYLAYSSESLPDQTTPYIMIEESWIQYDGVVTDLGSLNNKGAQTKLNVEYDSSTGESYIWATICNKAGTLTLNVDRTGPLNLYGDGPAQVTELLERNLLIWIYRDSENPSHWVMDWYGDNTYGKTLHFVPQTENHDYLPAGRYYLRTSAPESGNWIDFSAESPSEIGIKRGEALSMLLDSEECYIDITTQMGEGSDKNTITGSVKTADGRYLITFDYSGAFDY